MKIISFYNQKGGCAKTTSTLNLGAELVLLNYRVLLIDNDFQSNLTLGCGIRPGEFSLLDCFKGTKKLKDIILKCPTIDMDIIPCNDDYSNIDSFKNVEDNKSMLKKLIHNEKLDYDYVLIDCHPSFDIPAVNSLTASDSIIIPIESGAFNIHGLSKLVKNIKLIQKSFNSKLSIEGVLLTRIDSRNKLGNETLNDLTPIFGDKIFKTLIHQSTPVVRSQAAGLPISLYDPKCRVSREYKELAKEVLNNGKKK